MGLAASYIAGKPDGNRNKGKESQKLIAFRITIMKEKISQNQTLILLILSVLTIFMLRIVFTARADVPRLFDLFDTLTVAGSLLIVVKNHRILRKGDWIIALALGGLVGVEMIFATLFSPYPFWGIVNNNLGQAWVRAILTTSTALCGLAIMRHGGPVPFYCADGNWRKAGRGVLVGLAIGLPLAVLNTYALQLTQGQAVDWQNPLAAMLDAIQPGIVEEVVYRFALWGLFWLVLRSSLSHAEWVSGLLAMLVHNYAHFDEMFLQSPLVALSMGLVMALIWGFPPLIVARQRGLESAIDFHWIEDVARVLAGF